MDDIQAVHDASQKILDREKISFDENIETIEREDFFDNIDPVEDVLDDENQDLVREVPPPQPKKLRKKRKTEVEKLKIDLKGWEMMKSPDPNSLQAVKLSAAPFIHNFMSTVSANITVQNGNNNMEMGEGRGAEIEDEEFDVIYDDDTFDHDVNISLL